MTSQAAIGDDLYGDMIESVPAMLWLGDVSGHCVFLNRAQREFWGVRNRDLSDFDWLRTLHPQDTDLLFGPYAAAMEAQEGFEIEARYRRWDGDWRILRSTARPRHGPDGRFMGMVGVNVDVTEQRRAEEKLRRSSEHLRLALDASGAIGTWLWNVEENRVFADAPFAVVFGVDVASAAEGAPVETFVDGILPADQGRVAELIERTLQAGGAFEAEFRLSARPGRWYVALGNCETDGLGRPTVFPGVVIDITERRDREERLSVVTQELTHRIKNVFSVISAMTSLAAKADPGAAGSLQDLRERFHAMSAAYTRVTGAQADLAETRLDQLLGELFAPYGGPGRVSVEAPDLSLGPRAASSLALILHELATNAAKYGALSADGSVSVVIRTEGNAIRIDWAESGGPVLDGCPGAPGFGSRLIAACLSTLGATQSARWDRDGLRWSMSGELEGLRS